MWGLFVFLVEQLELCEPEPQVGRMGGGRWMAMNLIGMRVGFENKGR